MRKRVAHVHYNNKREWFHGKGESENRYLKFIMWMAGWALMIAVLLINIFNK